MLMRHAAISRLMGLGVGMRMIVRSIPMRMRMGVNDNLATAAASYAVLAADLAGSPTFGTCFNIFHQILPGCSVAQTQPIVYYPHT